MTENNAGTDAEPIAGEPRDCCAPGRSAFLLTPADRPAEEPRSA